VRKCSGRRREIDDAVEIIQVHCWKLEEETKGNRIQGESEPHRDLGLLWRNAWTKEEKCPVSEWQSSKACLDDRDAQWRDCER